MHKGILLMLAVDPHAKLCIHEYMYTYICRYICIYIETPNWHGQLLHMQTNTYMYIHIFMYTCIYIHRGTQMLQAVVPHANLQLF